MKRRTEHLVLKRDGRREFLRATKLARTIHLALHSVGIDEDWRALEVANAVLTGLRQKRKGEIPADEMVLTTAEIADAAQHLLVITGQAPAAVAYGAVAAERGRRRNSLATLGRFTDQQVAAPPAVIGAPAIGAPAAGRRFGAE
jgi:hypothetical protein